MESALSDTPQHLRQLHQQNSDVQQKGLGVSPHYRNIAESFFNRDLSEGNLVLGPSTPPVIDHLGRRLF